MSATVASLAHPKTKWWQGRMVGFDLETTSADPEQARIVSAALVAVGAGGETEKWTQVVNPGVEIPQEAIDIHGITNEQARRDGIPEHEALATIMHYLERVADRGWPLVVMNARYDLTVADRALRRLGVVALAKLVLPRLKIVDPIVIEKHLDRYRPKRIASHSLEDACRVWNVKLDIAHDAAFDALAACRLAYRLAKDGRVIRRTRGDTERREYLELAQEWERVRHDLDALQEWQRRIAAAEAQRLELYFRTGDERKGVPAQPDRKCPRDWPIIPVGWEDTHEQIETAAELLTPDWTT